MVEHALEERGVDSPILSSGTINLASGVMNIISFINQITSYLFPSSTAQFQYYGYILLVFCAVMVAGLLVQIRGKKWALKTSVSRFLTTLGAVGFLIYLFRYEQVLYFNSVVLFWLLYGGALIWLIWILVIRITHVPKVIEAQKRKVIKAKYLPRTYRREE